MQLTLVVASLEVCEVIQVLVETEDWTWGLVLIDLLMVKRELGKMCLEMRKERLLWRKLLLQKLEL